VSSFRTIETVTAIHDFEPDVSGPFKHDRHWPQVTPQDASERSFPMALPLILEIQTGKYRGRQVKLTDKEIVVGRDEKARIRISSAEVSREHCILIPAEDRVLVRDLASRNGTFVDGRPIAGEKILYPGGTLTVGPLTFLLLGGRPLQAPSAGVAIGGKAGSVDSLSDDDIASWLSDDEIPTSSNLGSDTTIIPGIPASTPAVPRAPAEPVSVPAPPMPAKRREFKSIAEEAQEIIRRHFEMLEQQSH
jgi:pSer/pThr/pTyr-binding forkhead associated (FHA) protein